MTANEETNSFFSLLLKILKTANTLRKGIKSVCRRMGKGEGSGLVLGLDVMMSCPLGDAFSSLTMH